MYVSGIRGGCKIHCGILNRVAALYIIRICPRSDLQRTMHKKGIIILLSLLGLCCLSFVSTNVPLGHWSYDAIDKLVGAGLIDSAMIATKPLSRLEMGRCIAEACEKAEGLQEKNRLILAVLDRLKKEFEQELITLGAVDGASPGNFLKPVEDPYVKYLYGDNRPDTENLRGDEFDEGSNYRAGFASRMQIADTVALYLHPEYPVSSEHPDRDVKLIEAYGKIGIGKAEVEVGKDSLWWGPGYHGSILMSNNAQPFKMIKVSNDRPMRLPWIFSGLGPFKAVWFLTELEKDRTIPEPKLTGLRINFKPHPAFDLGLSRAIIFGGQGRPSVTVRDYWNIFWATQENRAGNLDNDQLAGFDASVLIPTAGLLPARSIKLYTDWIGEDEASGLPSSWGKLYGVQLNDLLRTGRTDLRIEYADDHVADKLNVFYNHHIYRSGYTYKGRIIGHPMGTDARDLFFRLSHYLTQDIILGVEYDKETSNLSSSPQPSSQQCGFDLTFFTPKNWQLKTGYRYENTKNSTWPDNQLLFVQVTYDF